MRHATYMRATNMLCTYLPNVRRERTRCAYRAAQSEVVTVRTTRAWKETKYEKIRRRRSSSSSSSETNIIIPPQRHVRTWLSKTCNE